MMFLVKADDDILVNPGRLVDILEDQFPGKFYLTKTTKQIIKI
jgi:hypothetical protein